MLTTSVFGGVFDDEFQWASRDFFDQIKGGHFALIDAGRVSTKYSNDALHVAVATVSGCPAIVSWNFGYIVHADKIPLYDAITISNKHDQIAISSPLEVMKYEDQTELCVDETSRRRKASRKNLRPFHCGRVEILARTIQ